MAENQATTDPPKSISFDTLVMDVCCHPSRDMVAVGDIDGQVSVHSYASSGSNHRLMSFDYHKKSCRRVRFNSDGSQLVTVSKDKSLRVVDMSTGAVTQTIKKAHASAIYSLLVVNDNIVATGDEDGKLKVWDLRHQHAVMELRECDDYLSDMIVDPTKRIVVATSGEGTLTAFDIRKHKLILQSELLDSGLLSIAVVKSGTKVVCGSDEGVLDIFNWGEWGNISDRFPGHPMSVDALVAFTDNIVFTGASDGVIRAVNILPNRIIGEVGSHTEFPVEALSLSHCRRWLASCSHDQLVKFSDVRDIAGQKVDGHKKLRRGMRPKPLTASAAAASGANFFADLEPTAAVEGEASKAGSDSDSSDSDDESSSDDEKLASDNETKNASNVNSKQKTKTASSPDKNESESDDMDGDSNENESESGSESGSDENDSDENANGQV